MSKAGKSLFVGFIDDFNHKSVSEQFDKQKKWFQQQAACTGPAMPQRMYHADNGIVEFSLIHTSKCAMHAVNMVQCKRNTRRHTPTWNEGLVAPSLCSTIKEWQTQMLSQKSAVWNPNTVSSTSAPHRGHHCTHYHNQAYHHSAYSGTLIRLHKKGQHFFKT